MKTTLCNDETGLRCRGARAGFAWSRDWGLRRLAGVVLLVAAMAGFVPATRGAGAGLYVDNVGIGTQAPLCIDSDANGLSDVWEQEHLGGVGNDTSADDDGDGASVLDEFVAGTDPDDPESVLRIVSVDLSSPSSDDASVVIAGGDAQVASQFAPAGDRNGRQFHVRAVDDPEAMQSVEACVADTGAGQQVWIDTNAVTTASARYYRVVATYGGHSASNTEEWAIYAQPRAANRKYLVSVPVDLGASNNLNSTLGQQLARGLHAGADQADSDELLYRAGNAWQTYYLTTNTAGKTLWWDVAANAVADLAVSAGMGFWIERKGSNDRLRDNCVLAGRSFTSAPSLSFATNNVGSDGWTWAVFGWPLATPLRHEGLGAGATPANQLGFAQRGYGGSSGDTGTDHPEQGDQIWVWANNTFADGYWLMDGIDADHNGRWARYNFGRQPADFALEPGRAYLYRHHVSLTETPTGTNFVWQPEP